MAGPKTQFEFGEVARSKLYTAIIEQIIEGIRSGTFPPGHALPAERALAVRFRVGRSSLREAIRVLEHAGVLDVRTGSGTYVSAEGLTNATILRTQAVIVGEQSPLDVIGARRLIEPSSTELAAVNRDEVVIQLLRRILNDHARVNDRGGDIQTPSMSFHLTITAASGNPVLTALVGQLLEAWQGRWSKLQHPAARSGSEDIEQHRAIFRAIEEKDAPRARRAMEEHLASVEIDLQTHIQATESVIK